MTMNVGAFQGFDVVGPSKHLVENPIQPLESVLGSSENQIS